MMKLHLDEKATNRIIEVLDKYKTDVFDANTKYQGNYRNSSILIDNNNILKIESENISVIMREISRITNVDNFDAIYVVETIDKDNPQNICILSLYIKTNDYKIIDASELENIDVNSNKNAILYGKILSKNLMYKCSFINKLDCAQLNLAKFSTNKLKSLAVNHCILSLVREIGHRVPVLIESYCTIESYIKHLDVSPQKYLDVVMLPSNEENVGTKYAKILAKYALLVKKAQARKKQSVS